VCPIVSDVSFQVWGFVVDILCNFCLFLLLDWNVWNGEKKTENIWATDETERRTRTETLKKGRRNGKETRRTTVRFLNVLSVSVIEDVTFVISHAVSQLVIYVHLEM